MFSELGFQRGSISFSQTVMVFVANIQLILAVSCEINLKVRLGLWTDKLMSVLQNFAQNEMAVEVESFNWCY